MTGTALVLAGSRPGRDSLAEHFGVPLKALIPVAGEPMVKRPVQALLDHGGFTRLVVAGQSPERLRAALPDDKRIELRASRASIAETLLDIVNDPDFRWPLLVTTADHALLDAATIAEFLEAGAGADIAIAVVDRARLLERLPGTRRTWLKFRGGAFTGANLFILRSPSVAAAIRHWRSAEQGRKKGWRLLSLLGPANLAGVAFRLLSLDSALARLSRRLGLEIRAVRLSNPLAGIDVDKLDDHRLVESVLAGKA